MGRVLAGMGTVSKMAAMPSDEQGRPEAPLRIGLCGVLVGGGLERALSVTLEMRALQAAQAAAGGAGAAKETPAEASARVRGSVQSAVAEALQAQKSAKSAPPASGGDGGGAGVGILQPGGTKRKAEAASGLGAKKGMWDALLGDDYDESGSDEGGQGGS